MHYIGMLAFSMPVPMFYDPLTVFLSLFAAIGASAVALFTVSRKRMGAWQVVLGSICMGSGIAAMHYIGMAALRVSARVSYNPWLVLASILLAVTISSSCRNYIVGCATSDVSRARGEKNNPAQDCERAGDGKRNSRHALHRYVGSPFYTFRLFGWPLVRRKHLVHRDHCHCRKQPPCANSGRCDRFLDRLLSAQKAVAEAVDKGEKYFRTMADAIPQIIWTALPSGELDFYNGRWSDYTGKNPSQSGDWGWEVNRER